jgi:hypothetical protein
MVRGTIRPLLCIHLTLERFRKELLLSDDTLIETMLSTGSDTVTLFVLRRMETLLAHGSFYSTCYVNLTIIQATFVKNW